MKFITLILSVILICSNSFAIETFNSVAIKSDNPLMKSCEFVYSDSLSIFACLKHSQEDLNDGKNLDLVVADTCNALMEIPENAKYFSRCFALALPNGQVPPGYPIAFDLCKMFVNKHQELSPDAKMFEGWHCSSTIKETSLKQRNEICLIQWNEGNGQRTVFLGDRYVTLPDDQELRPYSQYGNSFEFDIDTKEYTLHSGDPRVLNGTLIGANSKTTRFKTDYKQSWSATMTTNYILDKMNQSMTISKCKHHLLSCANISNRNYTCTKL